jgi:2-haloacid dehalogenase
LISCDALDFALETLGLDDPPLRARLMDLYRTLDVFPEVPVMLQQLKTVGLKTAILSSRSPDHARRRRRDR